MRILTICLTAALGLFLSGPLAAETAATGPKFVEGYILVKPKPGLKRSKFEAILARSGGAAVGIRQKLDPLGIKTVKVPPGREREFAQSLRARREIDFAEPDYLFAPDEFQPDDPKYGSQWHLPMIAGPVAWDETAGASITIAIVDTGVYADHPDLLGRVLPGRNVVSDSDNSGDIMGHGTAVAGTAAAAGNNSLGIASVAYESMILPVRISDRTDGVASSSHMAEGIIWAADHGARVANLSYAAANSSAVVSAASYMRSAGGLVFVAAGNANSDPGWPNHPDLIVVSATDRSDSSANFSNFGQFVDIAAPGDYIYTTKKGGGYGNWIGTSFASPVVAGVAALVMARAPELDPATVSALIEQTADDKDAPGWDPYYGAGRVNAGAAVLAAASEPTEDRLDPTVAVVSPADGSIVKELVTIDVSAEDNETVVGVDLFVDGVPYASDFDSPYAFVWDSTSATNGAHEIFARARDAAGNVGTSSVVQISIEDGDQTGPDVTISSPLEADTVSGTVQVAAFASDDSGVQQITLTAAGKMLCAGSPNVSCGWNTRKLEAGNYSVVASATDNAGNVTTTGVNVTVSKGGGSKGGGGDDGGGNKGRGKKK